jgi:hypothetical protein
MRPVWRNCWRGPSRFVELSELLQSGQTCRRSVNCRRPWLLVGSDLSERSWPGFAHQAHRQVRAGALGFWWGGRTAAVWLSRQREAGSAVPWSPSAGVVVLARPAAIARVSVRQSFACRPRRGNAAATPAQSVRPSRPYCDRYPTIEFSGCFCGRHLPAPRHGRAE